MMAATSLDLSQIKTDALTSAATFRSLIGLGTLATQDGTITDYLTTATAASTYQPLDADLTALAALTGTNNIYYRSASNTWSSVTIGAGLSFTNGTLSSTLSVNTLGSVIALT